MHLGHDHTDQARFWHQNSAVEQSRFYNEFRRKISPLVKSNPLTTDEIKCRQITIALIEVLSDTLNIIEEDIESLTIKELFNYLNSLK